MLKKSLIGTYRRTVKVLNIVMIQAWHFDSVADNLIRCLWSQRPVCALRSYDHVYTYTGPILSIYILHIVWSNAKLAYRKLVRVISIAIGDRRCWTWGSFTHCAMTCNQKDLRAFRCFVKKSTFYIYFFNLLIFFSCLNSFLKFNSIQKYIYIFFSFAWSK